MSDTVVVVAGGDPPDPGAARGLPAGAFVIAADSGLDHARALGLAVDLVVGDMDSVSPDALAAARSGDSLVESHPAAKDQTDLELALDRARARHPARIVVLGGAGGRLDHLVGELQLLAAERYADHAVVARLGPATVTVVRATVTLRGEPGELVSLVPVAGPARDVTTEGLLYPLDHEDLGAGSSRGVSNQFLGAEAQVTVGRGVLLAIQPGRDGRATIAAWT